MQLAVVSFMYVSCKVPVVRLLSVCLLCLFALLCFVRRKTWDELVALQRFHGQWRVLSHPVAPVSAIV